MLLFLETDLQVIKKGLACFFYCAVKPWDQKKCPLKRGVHLWEVKNEKNILRIHFMACTEKYHYRQEMTQCQGGHFGNQVDRDARHNWTF